MTQAQVILQHQAGLHARPAAFFVKTAMRFASAITVTCKEKKANAKSMVQILTLGAHQGTEITIQAEGTDEQEAVTTLVSLIENNQYE